MIINAGVGSGGGGVTSFNGRTGSVTPQSGDYTASQVGALPTSGGTMNGVINMNGNRITNVGNAQSNNDAVNYYQFMKTQGLINVNGGFGSSGVYAEMFSSPSYSSASSKFSSICFFIPVGYSQLSGVDTIFYLATFTSSEIIGINFDYVINGTQKTLLGNSMSVQIMYPTTGLTFSGGRFQATQPGTYIVAVSAS